jgi:uncharacterized protein
VTTGPPEGSTGSPEHSTGGPGGSTGPADHASARDRDPSGRPRNARPRDGLGRPLPRGAPGDERIPDGLSLPPDEALRLAQHLLDTGRPFHAHEVLEASWKNAPAAERDLWQGLAQVAVGLTHAGRGNATGAAALLRRGGERVAAYASAPPHRVDAAGIAKYASELAGLIERNGLTARPARLTLTQEGT